MKSFRYSESLLKDKAVVLKLMLMGCVVFSPLSSVITMKILHFPISFPEILFVLFLPFCTKYFHFSSLKRRQTILFIFIWILLIIIGILVGKYSNYAILSTARSYLYLVVFYLLFCKSNNVTVEIVYYICIGAFFGWLIDAFISFKFITLSGDILNVSYGPMLCIPILLGVQVMTGRYKTLFFMLLLSIVLMVLSGMRRQMLITLMNKKIFLKYLVIISSIVTVIAISFPTIENLIKSFSGEVYFRVISKTESFIQGELTEGDEIRKDYISDFIENIDTYIFPHGFVSKQTATDPATGKFNDLPILEISVTIGFLGTLFLIIYFTVAACKCFKSIYTHLLPDICFVFVLSYAVIVVLLFIEGSFLTFPYAVPYTGYCLGQLQYYAYNGNKKKYLMRC